MEGKSKLAKMVVVRLSCLPASPSCPTFCKYMVMWQLTLLTAPHIRIMMYPLGRVPLLLWYLKSPGVCLMSVLRPSHGRIRDVLWLCLLGQPQENTACLLLQLLCQSGENKRVCSFYDSLPFLPALLVAYPGLSEQWYSKTHIHCTNVNFLVLILYSRYARCRI